eukprot:3632473-Alexandrium_andersonii.AAC.1
MRGLTLASLNCGRACGSWAMQETLLGTVQRQIPNVSILFCPEIDAFKNDTNVNSFRDFVMHRHYPGEGSVAMA